MVKFNTTTLRKYPQKVIPLFQLRCVYAYKKAYIRVHRETLHPITRAQVYFLCLLFAHGITENIRAKDLKPLGITYDSCRQYLYKLKGAGLANKQGYYWSINEWGRDYYIRFSDRFDQILHEFFLL